MFSLSDGEVLGGRVLYGTMVAGAVALLLASLSAPGLPIAPASANGQSATQTAMAAQQADHRS